MNELERKITHAKEMFRYWAERWARKHERGCNKSAAFWAQACNDYERELGVEPTKFMIAK